MKRYTDISYKLARISPLREDKNGEWIRHEDAKEFVRKLLGLGISKNGYTGAVKTYKANQIEMYVDFFYPENRQED